MSEHALAPGRVEGCEVCLGYMGDIGNPAHIARRHEERLVRAVAAMLSRVRTEGRIDLEHYKIHFTSAAEEAEYARGLAEAGLAALQGKP